MVFAFQISVSCIVSCLAVVSLVFISVVLLLSTVTSDPKYLNLFTLSTYFFKITNNRFELQKRVLFFTRSGKDLFLVACVCSLFVNIATLPRYSPGGSTLQWGVGRGLLCLARPVRHFCECHSISYYI